MAKKAGSPTLLHRYHGLIYPIKSLIYKIVTDDVYYAQNESRIMEINNIVFSNNGFGTIDNLYVLANNLNRCNGNYFGGIILQRDVKLLLSKDSYNRLSGLLLVNDDYIRDINNPYTESVAYVLNNMANMLQLDTDVLVITNSICSFGLEYGMALSYVYERPHKRHIQ